MVRIDTVSDLVDLVDRRIITKTEARSLLGLRQENAKSEPEKKDA